MSKLVFAGDFYYDYPYITDDIKKISEFVKKNDWSLIINLEAPLVESDEPIKKRGPNLAQGKKAIEVMRMLNVVGVCLANNHIMDYGEKALLQTIQLLDENGIAHCGAGNNLKEAKKPMCLEVDHQTLIVLNYGWDIEEVQPAGINAAGANTIDKQSVLEEIKKYSDSHAKVITIMHWGYEYNLLPQPYDVIFAHDMIEGGAGLVIGHHPHVIQAKDFYEQRNIYYSLGNFYFGSRRKNYKKTFHSEYCNECDYGLLLILDTHDWTIKEATIYYNKEIDASLMTDSGYIVTDISNRSLNRQYIREARQKKNHVNPFLTDHSLSDTIKLWYLQVIIRKVLRRVWLIAKK